MLGFECSTLADLDTKFSGRRPPIGPNSFIFTYILPKSAHIGGPRPLPQWVHNPPTGNPGSAPTQESLESIQNLECIQILA